MNDGLTGQQRFDIWIWTKIWCFLRGHAWVPDVHYDGIDVTGGSRYMPTGTQTCENCGKVSMCRCHFCGKLRGTSQWVCNGYPACKQCGPKYYT